MTTDDSERPIIEACDAAIDSLESEFRADPSEFFSELDIQRRYCTLLETELTRRRLPLATTNVTGERVALVHQDYGSAQGQAHRTDIVVLRPRELRNSSGSDMRIGGRYSQPLVALEFGTEKSEQKRPRGRGQDLCSHTERDFEKLRACGAVERRLVICYRDRSALARRADHRKTHEERVDRLRECVRRLQNQDSATVVRLCVAKLHP